MYGFANFQRFRIDAVSAVGKLLPVATGEDPGREMTGEFQQNITFSM